MCLFQLPLWYKTALYKQSRTSDDFKKYYEHGGLCEFNYELHGSHIAKTLCKVYSPDMRRRYTKQYFKFDKILSSSEVNVIHLSNRIFPRQSIIQTVQYYNLTTSACLCPPSFYGDIYQFQNERVSITIKFNATSDSIKIPFIIIVSLVDDSEERIIHSYQQFIYVPIYHCHTKFHAYLLYSTRPKNQTKHYSIHIDIYEKISLKCINGKCRRYFNDPNNTTFCQCKQR